ncbi:MAG: AbrB/MazE/SpoVT family DNA-binding domain-containing protein [Candidatus Omnitrophica bacterium]|nr:AbrB/MazE/SpoVT family DNA-binding domain-containing protein [Candidatus Omnitrophota bacterium]
MQYKAIRKISAIGPGKTYYLTFPKEIIKQLNWKKGEKKIVRVEGNKIIIEDWQP